MAIETLGLRRAPSIGHLAADPGAHRVGHRDRQLLPRADQQLEAAGVPVPRRRPARRGGEEDPPQRVRPGTPLPPEPEGARALERAAEVERAGAALTAQAEDLPGQDEVR